MGNYWIGTMGTIGLKIMGTFGLLVTTLKNIVLYICYGLFFPKQAKNTSEWELLGG